MNGANPRVYGRPGEPGDIIYFAPDTLGWTSLECGYADWLGWLFSDVSEEFYADVRWAGWREDVRNLYGTQGISVTPFLWSAEAEQEPDTYSRRPVPMKELLDMSRDFSVQLGGADPGFLGGT